MHDSDSTMRIRRMTPEDRTAVAELICVSTNYWYQVNRGMLIFPGGPESTTFHFDVYHALPGSFGFVAEHAVTGVLMGSCFVHDRPTHVSLGIMNVHPNYFGRHVGRRLLDTIVAFAEEQNKPVRLVSSAMNLDSFSLYTRAGFVPYAAFQDMYIEVPQEGMPQNAAPESAGYVRPATTADVPAIEALEWEVSHIRRPRDWEHFIRNPEGVWHVSVYDDGSGGLRGCLTSCAHVAANMIGPGVMRDETAAAALLYAELNMHRGRSPVFLVPVTAATLVQQAYAWGARNCETHFAQARGPYEPFAGVVMPTFMPETG